MSLVKGKGKAKVFYEVACKEHGTAVEKNLNLRYLRVAPPAHKGVRGCPLCKAESKKAAR